MGHVPPRPLREAGQSDDVPRRQHRRAGADEPDLTPAEHRRHLGNFGERLAADFLRRRGAELIARNVAVGRGEIDLIVRFGAAFAAVEVKTIIARIPTDDPLDHFTAAKAHQVRKLAGALDPPVHRVDVVAVAVGRSGVDVRWLPHAG